MASTALPFVPNPDSLQAWQALTGTFTDNLMKAHRAQVDMMLTWQQSITAIQQEWWDEWTAHFGGGAPFDV